MAGNPAWVNGRNLCVPKIQNELLRKSAVPIADEPEHSRLLKIGFSRCLQGRLGRASVTMAPDLYGDLFPQVDHGAEPATAAAHLFVT